MFGLNLKYIFSVVSLFCFGVLFFSVDYFLPQILVWKSHKLHALAQIYLDEEIDNVGGLIDQGIQKAGIAHLLNPSDTEILLTYIKLCYLTNPAQALIRWSSAIDRIESLEQHTELLQKAIETLKQENISVKDRTVAAEISFKQINYLMQNASWASNPDNTLIFCELLAETGQALEAQKYLNDLLDNYPSYPEAVFLLTRVSVHLKDDSQLVKIGRLLASLSSQRNETGLVAIRHMTLLHLLNPLSPKSLEKCIELLQSNPKAEPIDYMRIYALQYASERNTDKKNSIIDECASLFDLESRDELIIYSSWLARLGNFKKIIQYLSASKARVDEDLFKMRMNALAQIGDLESILTEVSNAPLIPTLWRKVVEARAYSMQNKLQDSFDVLDSLLPLLDDDPREVRAVCSYLEASNDIDGLCHILEKLIDQSIHSKFALIKLLEHKSATASIGNLQTWIEKLSKIDQSNISLTANSLYFQTLNAQLPAPSAKLNKIITRTESLLIGNPLPQLRITLALAHLRNGQADKSLVALGKPLNWRQWVKSRVAWSLIASEVYRLNNDSEKALLISKNIDLSKLNRSEKESLKALFPARF